MGHLHDVLNLFAFTAGSVFILWHSMESWVKGENR